MTRSNGWTWPLVAIAALLLAYVVVRSAWIADDALITFRSVQNLVDGYGPRWNVEDRVQTFTHPLWMLGLSGVTLLTGDLVLAAHGLGLFCTGVAVLLMIRIGGGAPVAAGLIALIGSRAFVDYSASGLENPLTHLLLAAFTGLLVRDAKSPPSYGWLVLVASLAMLNRMDTALLVGPTLTLAAWRHARAHGWLGTVARTWQCSAPLWLWLGFAAIYYGTPLPIAAYAKAFCSGLPSGDLAAQAGHYFAWTWRHDPITLVVIGTGLLATLLWVRSLRLLALGAVLYLTYLFRIGGDFMGGRFFAAPFFCAVLGGVLALHRMRPQAVWITALGVVLLWWPGREPTLTAARGDYENRVIEADGIADERGFYYQQFGWLSVTPSQIMPFGTLSGAIEHQDPAGRTRGIRIVPGYAIGAMALWLGRDGYLLDPLLCDPLLARLPGYDLEDWRIGHVWRRLPAGYIASLRSGANELEDPDLRVYWATLRSVLRDDVFSSSRLSALWRLWTGADAEHLARYTRGAYLNPSQVEFRAEQVAEVHPIGTPFYDPRIHVLNPAGLRVRWPEVQLCDELRLGLDAIDTYRITFWNGDRSLGTTILRSGGAQLDGLRDCRLEVDPAFGSTGFDAITVTSEESDDAVSAVGFVRCR